MGLIPQPSEEHGPHLLHVIESDAVKPPRSMHADGISVVTGPARREGNLRGACGYAACTALVFAGLDDAANTNVTLDACARSPPDVPIVAIAEDDAARWTCSSWRA